MQKHLRKRLAVAVGALGLVHCDASPPEAKVSEPVDTKEAGAQPAEPEEAAAQPIPPEQAVPRPVELPKPTQTPLDPAQSAAAEAIAQAMLAEDPYARASKLAALLPTLGPEGVPGAKEALRNPRFGLHRGGVEIELLARYWARQEPREANLWALREAASGYRLSALFVTLSQWAASDPESARAAAEEWQRIRRDVRNILQIGLVYGWFENDPDGLAQYIAQLEMGFPRQRMLGNYVRLLIQQQGVEAAMHWAESVPEDDVVYKENVYRQMGAALADYDTGAAVGWCEAHCEGPYGTEVRTLIADSWALTDGVGALGWLLSNPGGQDWNAALKGAFGNWARKQPDAVSAWMARIQAGPDPGPWLQQVLPIYTLIAMRESPAEAITWAERIQDERQRQLLLIRVARAWRWQDEAAAEAWLDQSPLSEEDRAKARLVAPPIDRPWQK